MKKEKPKIIVKKIEENNKIKELVIKVVVKKFGNGAIIFVPKELIGKYVEVRYVDI